ncbi:unnamed protein product [Paramecium octaurelia]|uniref:Uncharacterized protein n=1 Tax=Paramecium octaurelia TaxID=43137 RepID=A0A8S1RZU5_PAROT|nr:unnamed protein product [Paramecium octaurelia]
MTLQPISPFLIDIEQKQYKLISNQVSDDKCQVQKQKFRFEV